MGGEILETGDCGKNERKVFGYKRRDKQETAMLIEIESETS